MSHGEFDYNVGIPLKIVMGVDIVMIGNYGASINWGCVVKVS